MLHFLKNKLHIYFKSNSVAWNNAENRSLGKEHTHPVFKLEEDLYFCFFLSFISTFAKKIITVFTE